MLGGLGFYAVNLVDDVVLTSGEGALDDNIMCGHREILSVRIVNLPAGEGVAFLGRNVVNLDRSIESVLGGLGFYAVNLVDDVVLSRLPLCVQVQAGHQRSRLVCLGAVHIGVPTDEFVVFTRRQFGLRIAARLIVGAGLGVVRIDFIFREIRMVGDSNFYILNVAVDMVAIVQLFNGVPYDLDVFSVEVLAQTSEGITGTIILAVFPPVVLIEETEVFRKNQIFVSKANVINLGITVRELVTGAMLISHLLAQRGQIAACVAGYIVASVNAAVRQAARQVVVWALACAARRLITVWQKYEVLDFVLFRLPRPCEVD